MGKKHHHVGESDQALGPVRELARMQAGIDRIMQSFLGEEPSHLPAFARLPACDVEEDGAQFVAKLDIPGVPKEKVRIEADRNTLAVSGEREEANEASTAKSSTFERWYGSFARTISFPVPIDEKQVKARFENGVLTVTLPKEKGAERNRVEIQ